MAHLPIDIADQDELAAHRYDFWFVPRRWATYAYPTPLVWTPVPLRAASRPQIPTVSGIYSLLLQPSIAQHGACSYLMYIGQSVSLHARFGNYLGRENRPTGRPKLRRLLFKYPEHLWFCFAQVPQNQLDACEDALIAAYLPPCNDQFPAEVRPAVGAFRCLSNRSHH